MRTLLLIVSFCASTALADLPPPNAAGCNGKSEGASCKTDANAAGACAKSTCSRLDYSDGSPPGTVQYDCLLCQAGKTPAGGCSAVPGGLLLCGLALGLGLRRRS